MDVFNLPWLLATLFLSLPSVLSAASCSDVSSCTDKLEPGSTLACFGGACAICSPNAGYPAASSGPQDCSAVCQSPLTVDGQKECQKINVEAASGATLYCNDILKMDGYTTSPATYVDSSGTQHSFKGICAACRVGKIVSAKGDSCIDTPSPPPSPPPKSSSPRPVKSESPPTPSESPPVETENISPPSNPESPPTNPEPTPPKSESPPSNSEPPPTTSKSPPSDPESPAPGDSPDAKPAASPKSPPRPSSPSFQFNFTPPAPPKAATPAPAPSNGSNLSTAPSPSRAIPLVPGVVGWVVILFVTFATTAMAATTS